MEWTNCNKNLPQHYERVLVVLENGQQAFAFRAPKKEKARLELYNVYEVDVVKWKEMDKIEG